MADDKIDDSLLDALGVKDLDQDKRDEIIGSFAESLQNRFTMRLLDMLPDSEKDALDNMTDDPEKIADYLKERVPEADKILQSEYKKLLEEIREEQKLVFETFDKLKK